ncbi:MAG: CHASE2 domain-containing protein [Cyclobacteriaceae bacterium]|nr:CHASE2 domain-containing protein [Cyclobacteriaceae bacterium]
MKILTLLLILVAPFCQSQSAKTFDPNIILINVGDLDRVGIAKQLGMINKLNPKVVALDLIFQESHGDNKDKLLIKELSGCKNLVMATLIKSVAAGSEKKYMVSGNHAAFLPPRSTTGFTNLILEKDESQIKFAAWRKVNERPQKDTEYHFSIQTAMAFDSSKTSEFLSKNLQTIDIDYSYDLKTVKRYSVEDVLTGKINSNDVEGKIVLLGFLGPGDEDKTKIIYNNEVRSLYEMEILATILSQVLNAR